MRKLQSSTSRTISRALLRSLGAGAFAALVLALCAGSASALVVHLANGRTVSYEPLKGATQLSASPFARALAQGRNLLYGGGPVMPANTNYALYWAPAGSPAYAAGYQSGVNRYLEDLAHDSGGNQNVDSVATQYGDSEGHVAAYSSHWGGALLDTHAYPANGCVAAPKCLTAEQIEAEIQRFVEAEGLPTGLEHEYFLLTPPGVESCFEANNKECSAGATVGAAYCAFHFFISSPSGPIVYANDPYVVGNEGCDDGEHPNGPADAALQGGLSHEHNESITDPEGNAWVGPEGNENGDKCRTFQESTEFGTPLGLAEDGSHYNQLVNGDKYWYQQEWSNEGSTCLQRVAAASAPTLTKLSPKKGAPAGGTSVTIPGTGFSGASAGSFGSTPAASFVVASSTSITAVAPAHTSETVDVTVTTPGGTSALVSKDRCKYGSPTVGALAPASGPLAGGTSVTISGSGFAPGTGTTSFKFGKALAGSVQCSSTSSCTALSPAGSKAASVDVIALVGTAKSKKSPPGDSFTYE